jgi:hypothetical protein
MKEAEQKMKNWKQYTMRAKGKDILTHMEWISFGECGFSSGKWRERGETILCGWRLKNNEEI